MSNFEKIKNMTIEEMVVFFCKGQFGCDGCWGQKESFVCNSEHERIRKWLEEEEYTEK